MNLALLGELKELVSKPKKTTEEFKALVRLEQSNETKVQNENEKFNKRINGLLAINKIHPGRSIIIDEEIISILKTPEEKAIYVLTGLINIKKDLLIDVLIDLSKEEKLSFDAIARGLNEYAFEMSVDGYVEISGKIIDNITKGKGVNREITDYNTLRLDLFSKKALLEQEKPVKQQEIVKSQEIVESEKPTELDKPTELEKSITETNGNMDILELLEINVETEPLKQIDIKYDLNTLDLSKLHYTNKGVKSYAELLDKINKLPLTNKVLYKKLFRRLEKIKYIIQGQDPLKYIAYLYYNKKMSLNGVQSELNNIGIDWALDTLDKNFKELFVWKKRNDKDAANTQIRNDKCQKNTREETQKKVESILNLLGEGNQKFSRKSSIEYLQLTNTNERVKYILEELGYIQFGNFKKYIITLQSVFGPHAITRALNIFLERITSANNLAKVNYNKARIYELIKD